MKESTRARVAAIIGAATKKKTISSIYDYSCGHHKSISADVLKGNVTGFDYGTSSHFSGVNQVGKLDFFDYETSSHIDLKLEGNKFSGFDYCTSAHFSGNINGNSISLYD